MALPWRCQLSIFRQARTSRDKESADGRVGGQADGEGEGVVGFGEAAGEREEMRAGGPVGLIVGHAPVLDEQLERDEGGRASCRERV